MEEFADAYKLLLGDLENKEDLKDLTKMNKNTLADHLISALNALKLADKLCKKQSDTIMKTTNELLEQTKLARNNSEKLNGLNEFNAEKIKVGSYADIVKNVPAIILKKTESSKNISSDEMKNKMKNALQGFKVAKTKVKQNGTMIVETANHENFSGAISSLQKEFSDFSVAEAKKISPKLTIINVPNDLTGNDLIDEIAKKDDFIKNCIDNNEEFSIINSWDMKNKSGKISAKKFAIKCSPLIRNYIINNNNGYVYLNLLRCKVFDRYYVPQCYHCQRFNHFSRECPDKEKSPVCGKCSGGHVTKNCTVNSSKCINCVRNKEKNNNHASFSHKCPVLVGLKNKVMAKTEYIAPSKNLN